MAAGCFYQALAADPCATCSGFPDKDANSGRFVTVTVHEATLGDVDPGQKVIGISLQVSKSIPAGSTFQFGIFDGDIGGFWDTFTPPTPDVLDYFMFADPNKLASESGTDVLAAANGNVQVTSQFPGMDNQWVFFTITQNAAAQAPGGGDLFYHFLAKWETTNNPNEQNLFKVSVDGIPFLLAGSTVGFLGTDNSVNGPAIPIPGSPTFDGTFTFLFNVANATTAIRLWDGDADYEFDTDDFNTGPCLQKLSTDPVCPDIPFLVSGAAQPEGANPGNPPEPDISYTVTGPFGTVTNNDPSGNQEIELYRIGLTGDATADVTVPTIPAGFYQWNWKNVGVFNNIFIHADFDIVSCPGNPGVCPQLQPPGCNIVPPQLVKAAPGRLIPFTVTNTGAAPGTVSIKPFSNGACFQIVPGSPQQVQLAPGQSYTFTLVATSCPLNAGKQPQNASIIVTTSCGPSRIVQVEWVNKL